uniref:Uncharacterized protein n=1 Tax=Tanacetum cinerariifolium TaxID=118510 RepID=A0A699JKI3_TANCI|nr:hypothetical protein [Tanacetum cinerariifolium]
MSQKIVHIAVNSVDSLDVKKSCVNDGNKCLELEAELRKKKDLIEKDVYDKLLKSYSTLEKDKKVRFTEPVISSSNIPKQTDSLKTKDSNKPLLTSIGVKPTTSASGSKPSGYTKNNRISRPPSNNQKNKVEYHSSKVKSSLNKMNSISEPVSNALVKHSMRNAKSESICAIYNKCLFDANHDKYVIDYVNDVNGSTVSDVPSSSLNDCILFKLLCGIWTPNAPSMRSEIALNSSTSLSHLNSDYITSLAKQGLVRGLPKIKYQKDHLCSAYALGKSKKHSHKPKAEDSI